METEFRIEAVRIAYANAQGHETVADTLANAKAILAFLRDGVTPRDAAAAQVAFSGKNQGNGSIGSLAS